MSVPCSEARETTERRKKAQRNTKQPPEERNYSTDVASRIHALANTNHVCFVACQQPIAKAARRRRERKRDTEKDKAAAGERNHATDVASRIHAPANTNHVCFVACQQPTAKAARRRRERKRDTEKDKAAAGERNHATDVASRIHAPANTNHSCGSSL